MIQRMITNKSSRINAYNEDYNVVVSLLSSNSDFNPSIYAARMRNYRRAYKAMILCDKTVTIASDI